MLDVPADIMDAILTYMYTGKVKDIDQTAYYDLPKANEYQLEGLKMKCEEALIKALTSQTVIDILLMADMHNAQKLRESCMLFIAQNIIDVKKSSAWMEEKLNNTNKDLLMEVLGHIVNLLWCIMVAISRVDCIVSHNHKPISAIKSYSSNAQATRGGAVIHN